MKKLLICCLLFSTFSLLGQNAFNDCVAACLNKVSLIADYSPKGIANIDFDAKGTLAVYTVEISEKAITPRKKIKFRVAIRDGATQTIWSFSEMIYQEIPAETILANCKKGDSILLLTVDRAYAFPHNEIVIN